MPKSTQDCQRILDQLGERESFLADVCSHENAPDTFRVELDSVRAQLEEVKTRMAELTG